MNEHLTVEELLISLKYCTGQLGGASCIGCPNAVAGSADKDGMCKCRFNTTEEMIHLLETLAHEQRS